MASQDHLIKETIVAAWDANICTKKILCRGSDNIVDLLYTAVPSIRSHRYCIVPQAENL